MLFWDIRKGEYSDEYSFKTYLEKNKIDILPSLTVVKILKLINPAIFIDNDLDFIINFEKANSLYNLFDLSSLKKAEILAKSLYKDYPNKKKLKPFLSKIYAKLGYHWKYLDLSKSEHYLSISYSYANDCIKNGIIEQNVYIALSIYYRTRGIWKDALKNANVAYQMNRSNIENIINLCELYSGIYFPYLYDYNKALKYLNEAKLINKNDFRIDILEGCIYVKKGKHNEALLQFIETLNKNRSLDRLYNNIGALYYEQGNFCKAENYFKEAVGLSKNNILVMINLALCYEANEKSNNALNYWQKIKNHPAADYNIKTLSEEHISYLKK